MGFQLTSELSVTLITQKLMVDMESLQLSGVEILRTNQVQSKLKLFLILFMPVVAVEMVDKQY